MIDQLSHAGNALQVVLGASVMESTTEYSRSSDIEAAVLTSWRKTSPGNAR
jgi:hypothetical protein